MKVGGIVLCGGQSTRMGYPKATLPFGSELMLERVVRVLGEVVDPIVVVAAPEQKLPKLPSEVVVTHDQDEQRGPLEGLRVGLKTLQGMVDGAFATSCDVPLIRPEFVQFLVESLTSHQIVVPTEAAFHHPLAAVYRTDVLPVIQSLLSANRMRPVFLFDEVDTKRIPVENLRSVDTDLRSLMNLNTPDDYVQACQQAGGEPDRRVLAKCTHE